MNASVLKETDQTHPLRKAHYLISSRSVNYENLTAFEAAAMALVFLLSVTTGVLMSLPIS